MVNTLVPTVSCDFANLILHPLIIFVTLFFRVCCILLTQTFSLSLSHTHTHTHTHTLRTRLEAWALLQNASERNTQYPILHVNVGEKLKLAKKHIAYTV